MLTLANNITNSQLPLPASSSRVADGVCVGRKNLVSQFVVFAFVVFILLNSAAFLALEMGSRSNPVLGWLTLLPLLAVIRIFSARTSALCGAIWGAALFCFLAFQTDPIVLPTVASAAFLVGLPAAFAFGMVLLTRRFGFNPLILALGWCCVELALLPLGLRGGLLGGVAGDSGSFLSFLQGLLGYVCMSALVVAVNALALSLLTQAYARVCSSQLYIRGSAGPQPRVIPREVPIRSPFYGHAAQPRAPPVALAV